MNDITVKSDLVKLMSSLLVNEGLSVKLEGKEVTELNGSTKKIEDVVIVRGLMEGGQKVNISYLVIYGPTAAFDLVGPDPAYQPPKTLANAIIANVHEALSLSNFYPAMKLPPFITYTCRKS